MLDSPARVVEHLAAEPVRVWACLRLPLIALMLLRIYVAGVEHWLPVVYGVVLAVYCGAAVAWLVFVLRRPVPRWAPWVSAAIDAVAVLALCVASGGATAELLPLFLVLPISVAFQDRPALTAILGISTAVGYLAVWLIFSLREDGVEMTRVVYIQFGFLLWLAAATSALCLVLTRRSQRVVALMEVRRRLMSEAARAEERQNRELAEHLHDGPLQTLLAARLEVDELRERMPDPALDMVHAALQETAAGMRSTVTALHPQVLAQLGLTAAVRELVRQYDSRGDFIVEAELEDVGRPARQALLYRAARELLNNVSKHAAATVVRVRLRRSGTRVVLSISDDGAGFDPAIVEQRVAEGHIGLASLLVRIDALGGSMDVDSADGRGTTITVTSPAEAMAEPAPSA
ncbi:sensor histidine kinase [[Mycobacterium] wendilense]|uniref:ATP-binding protein n=1 Tax=[Mycobacterium] wendilense TaxID=3064284 RepID=A0ABM9M7X3_9MYCO|nr:ATP-binding protein [Mycolicibacterium sp. MU0050]CAJ1578367.1 ATP-binding protein [Mycolicibacterium sp. MU0050]